MTLLARLRAVVERGEPVSNELAREALAAREDPHAVRELATVPEFLEALGGHGQFPDDIAERVHTFDVAALEAFISACSEEYDCSGWGYGFPEMLWDEMTGQSVGRIPKERLDVARRLHERAGGWFKTVRGVGPVFVTTSEWLEMCVEKTK